MHSWNLTPSPLAPPIIKGGGVGPSLEGGGTKVCNFLLERRDKPVKGGLMYKWGVATFLLLYSSIIFTVCEGKVRFLYYFLALQSFELAMQDSDLSFYCTKI